jgi:hypothetical protein
VSITYLKHLNVVLILRVVEYTSNILAAMQIITPLGSSDPRTWWPLHSRADLKWCRPLPLAAECANWCPVLDASVRS